MITDLDRPLTALHLELTDRITPLAGNPVRRLGRPPEVTDAELVPGMAVAQVLLVMTMNGTGCAPRPPRLSICAQSRWLRRTRPCAWH